MKLMEYRIGRKYAVQTIIESLRRCECSLMDKNVYLFDYYDEVLKTIGEDLGINFGLQTRTLQSIKQELGNTKRRERKARP